MTSMISNKGPEITPEDIGMHYGWNSSDWSKSAKRWGEGEIALLVPVAYAYIWVPRSPTDLYNSRKFRGKKVYLKFIAYHFSNNND